MLKKLLYINLFSITILSLFNYIVFHDMNSKAYLESFNAYNQRITNLAFKNIDGQIVEAAMEIPQFYFSQSSQNEDVLIPQEEEIIGSPERVRGLVSHMEEIRRAYPYVESVDVFYEGTHTAVTGYTTVHEASKEEDVQKYFPWYEEFIKYDQDTLFLENQAGVYPTQNPVITYAKKISQPKWKDRGIFIAVHISLDAFQKYIDEGEGSLILTTPSGRVLYVSSDSDREIAEDVLEKLSERHPDGWDNSLLSAKIQDENMTIFPFSATETGLRYIYYIYDSTFYADYHVRNRIFFMNFVISIVFNLLILLVLSWINHYTFKKQVLKASKEAGLELEKGKTSIDHSLNVMAKEIQTLNETVQSSKPLLWQNAIRAMLLNRDTELVKEELGTYLCYNSVQTVLIYGEEFQDLSDDVELLQKSFLDREDSYHVLFTTMERGSVVCVLIFDKEQEAAVAEDFLKEMKNHLEIRKVAWGTLFPLDKDNIKSSYKNAVETAQYSFVYPEQTILRYREMGMEGRKSSGSHLKLFDLIERSINSENYLDFKYHLESLLVSFKEGNYTVDYCRSTLRDLVALLYQIMNQKQLDMWIVFGYDIREYYKQVQDIDEYGRWILELCVVLLQNIRQKKESVDTDLQSQLLRLIDENLENDISLDFLADQVSMRLDVLSRLFKQMMGKGYTEYIKEKKMERAIELLQEDYSVKELAQKLGYNSPQYFIKIFKEIYGVTPYQYKKEHFPKHGKES